jgi:hypothetical protein
MSKFFNLIWVSVQYFDELELWEKKSQYAPTPDTSATRTLHYLSVVPLYLSCSKMGRIP